MAELLRCQPTQVKFVGILDSNQFCLQGQVRRIGLRLWRRTSSLCENGGSLFDHQPEILDSCKITAVGSERGTCAVAKPGALGACGHVDDRDSTLDADRENRTIGRKIQPSNRSRQLELPHDSVSNRVFELDGMIVAKGDKSAIT